jgi:pilus assembly protein CpaC
MFTKVTEDHGIGRDRSRSTSRSLRVAVIALAMGAVSVTGDAAYAQAKFSASIKDLTESHQRITIPLYRSLTIETSIETTRADVVSKQIADVQVISPTTLLITGENYGDTSVILIGKDHNQYVLEVHVELDLEDLLENARQIDPLASISARSVRGNILLTGTASSTDRARRIVELAALYLPKSTPERPPTDVQNHLDVAGEQQVLLRCTVAEVNRSASRELGVNGFLAGENFRDGFLVNQLGGINPINIGAAASAAVTGNVPFLTGDQGIPIEQATTLSLGFPRAQAQFFLKAMADNSLLSVLAEPNLVAISGETAHFLAGGEFPILVPQSLGTISIDFREFGVRLNFTPVVRGHQRIRLRVAPEVSELDFTTAVQFQGFLIPGLTSRATETTVELTSGQTIAIAGLLSEQIRGLASRIPAMGEIPILGTLFRSVNYQRSLTELVVLVTPEIVAPLEANQKVALPNDNLVVPDDYELYALGLIEGDDPKTGCSGADCSKQAGAAQLPSEPQNESLHGPWGLATTSDYR